MMSTHNHRNLLENLSKFIANVSPVLVQLEFLLYVIEQVLVHFIHRSSAPESK